MKDWALSNLSYWKLAIWKVYHGILTVIIGALPATIMNWHAMNNVEKIIAVGGVALAVHKFIDGFIDQTLARLVAGKSPIQLPGMNGGSHGQTEILKKTSEQASTTHPQPS